MEQGEGTGYSRLDVQRQSVSGRMITTGDRRESSEWEGANVPEDLAKRRGETSCAEADVQWRVDWTKVDVMDEQESARRRCGSGLGGGELQEATR